jgi:uracil-DNA glycosylase
VPPRQPPDSAERFIPPDATLDQIREAAQSCTACPLHESGTQTVFGEGPGTAEVMLVGEAPGDMEDRAGRPFVGPAGMELDKALQAVGIPRDEVYITNVVKHFKFEERGKRRIHQTPKRFEIEACKPWLEEELRLVQPEALVLLGATAAKALLGSSFRLTQHRGELLDSELAPIVAATIHPSAILRQRDDPARGAEREAFRLLETGIRRVGEPVLERFPEVWKPTVHAKVRVPVFVVHDIVRLQRIERAQAIFRDKNRQLIAARESPKSDPQSHRVDRPIPARCFEI